MIDVNYHHHPNHNLIINLLNDHAISPTPTVTIFLAINIIDIVISNHPHLN